MSMEPLNDAALQPLEESADEAVQGGAAAAEPGGICFVAWTQVGDTLHRDYAED
ncbi:MAG TPA: hypothetical protein VFR37_12500 [Longimicrobium sp.]|nr:hypothetical protein [Longimicrobium sp.]